MNKLITIPIILFCLGTSLANGEDLTSKSNVGVFIENKGQFRDQYGKPNPDVLYMADFGGMKVQIRKNGFSYETYQIKPKWLDSTINQQKIVSDKGIEFTYDAVSNKEANNLQYQYHRIDIELKNMNAGSLITTGERGKEGIRNIIPANSNMYADIYNYTNITFYNIYPDIDLVFKINDKQQFKYDFVIHPNGKVEDIQLEYKGADNLVLNVKGELEISSKFGDFIEKIPLSWYQQANGTKEIVEVEYNLTGSSLTFKSMEKQYQTLFIDPSANILWATYYGDSLNDSGTCLAIDSFDNVYMGGYTSSINNIATAGSYIDSLALPYDGYIVKFTNDGQRLWSTYLGGFRPNDMDMNALNQFVITSDSGIIQFNESGFPLWTYSRPNFGKALSYDHEGNVIAVGDSIIKLSSTGNLIWLTDYAGTSKLNDIDCDATGNIYIVGHTTDTVDISTAGAHQANYGGGTNAWQGVGVGIYTYMVKSSHGDGMVLKLNANGEKIWGTYYGGERFDEITSIAVSDDGDFAVSGLTNSLVNISSAGSFQPMLSRNNSIIFSQFCIGCSPDTSCGGMWVGDTCVDKVYGLPYTNHYQ
ncbi:MAG: SBBP repeat-containing protein, partial [Bacteroidales bacterium]